MNTIVEQATQYPFKCAISGTEVGPFIDTGVNYETRQGVYPEARIYIAAALIAEFAELAGILPDVQARSQHETSIYNRGKMDAVKEGLIDHVRRVADSLGAVAAELARGVSAVGTDEDDPFADAGE